MGQKGEPPIRKGRRFPFQVSVAAWVDLRGYGSEIEKSGFNPLHPAASDALKRLREFHLNVANCSRRIFPTLVINDGAVAYRDLSLRSRSVTHDFVSRAWKMFQAVKKSENELGFCSPRMVIAAGFRMRGRNAGIVSDANHFKSIMHRFQSGGLTVQQAISEAANIRRSFDILPQLQANFAFTKAYVAESSGAAGGFIGSNCFVDLSLFKTQELDWLKLGPAFRWNHEKPKLSGSFAAIHDFVDAKHPDGGPTELRDGLEVSQFLAEDENVLEALRTRSKS